MGKGEVPTEDKGKMLVVKLPHEPSLALPRTKTCFTEGP